MKKIRLFTFLITSLFHSALFAQGLNTELSFNDDYNQNVRGVLSTDNHSYLIYSQNSSSFFTRCAIKKIDTSGNVIWTAMISPQFGEIVSVTDVELAENDGLYVSGKGRAICDVLQGCYAYVQKFDPDGNILWTRIFPDNWCSMNDISGLTLAQGGNKLLLNYSDNTGQYIYTLNSDGSGTDSVQISLQNEVYGFADLSSYAFTAFGQNKVYGLDVMGNTINTLSFSTYVQDIDAYNDSLFVLTQDSIFIFNNALQYVTGNRFSGYEEYVNLKVDNTVRFIGKDAAGIALLTLNHQLQPVATPIAINSTSQQQAYIDYSSTHLTLGVNHHLTLYSAIRFLDYSLLSSENANIQRADIALVDIIENQLNVSQPVPNVYSIDVDASVLLINFGPSTLTSCRINRFVGNAICSDYFYTELITGLSIAPGDSSWIDLGMTGASVMYYPNAGDTILSNLCFYTSHPNNLVDLNVENDEKCRAVNAGYVGMEENFINNVRIYPNPASDLLNIEFNAETAPVHYTIFDAHGREISDGLLQNDRVNISVLPHGIYTLKLMTESSLLLFERFAVQRY